MNAVTEHRLRNNLAETRRIGALVEEFVRRNQLPSAVQRALDLSLTEWITNIISYGYADAAEHWISIRLSLPPGAVRVEVEDDGRQFNPLTLPPADTSLPLEQRAIGGLGVPMIRKLMDDVEYRRENGRNIVTMFKRRA
jgi:anti-sigma regulatory factor (Ser/Thr protein kinase)